MPAEHRIVPVRTLLTPSTFRRMDYVAKKHGVTVDMLLSVLADKAVRTHQDDPGSDPLPPRRTATRMTPDMLKRARAMRAEKDSLRTIAATLGVSYSTVKTHLRKKEDA